MGDSANIKLKRVFAGLCLISFSINGWVYGLISQRFRSGYRKTLKWCFGGIFDCVFNANRMKFETSLKNCGKTGVGSGVGSEFGSPTSFKPDKTSTPVQLSRSAKNALNAVDTTPVRKSKKKRKASSPSEKRIEKFRKQRMELEMG